MAPTRPYEIMKDYHRAWTSGDVETAMALVNDDVVCRAPGVDLHGRIVRSVLIFDRLSYGPGQGE